MANNSCDIDIDRPFLMNGDCAEQMRRLPDASIDAIVTDPPYGLSFMGKEWDSFGTDTRQPGDEHYWVPDNAYGRAKVRYGWNQNKSKLRDSMNMFQLAMTPIFAEALRVAKPGAHLLAFGGTRTYHRLACAIEDAGWEVRDCIMWVYGSGFPKSMDVSKAIDNAMGAKRTEVLGYKNTCDMRGGALMETQGKPRLDIPITAPATPEAAVWNGWGTCLKPAVEPIVVARKPIEGTVAANVLKYGTGAINIDGCRVPYESDADKESTGMNRPHTSKVGALARKVENDNDRTVFIPKQTNGRFPANLIHDGSDEVLALFPESKGQCGAVKGTEPSGITNGIYGQFAERYSAAPRGDSGSAARFFYCAKASRSERGEGNVHPTVKPLALMCYLVRLVTRKGGIVLDPFMGSGTTGVAAVQEGMRFVGVEKDARYYAIALDRIYNTKPEPARPVQEELPLTTEAM